MRLVTQCTCRNHRCGYICRVVVIAVGGGLVVLLLATLCCCCCCYRCERRRKTKAIVPEKSATVRAAPSRPLQVLSGQHVK